MRLTLFAFQSLKNIKFLSLQYHNLHVFPYPYFFSSIESFLKNEIYNQLDFWDSA